MGTTVGWHGKTKAEVFTDLYGTPWNGADGRYWVDQAHFTASGVWFRLNIQEEGKPARALIGFNMLQRRGKEWAEKGMYESMGPCDEDCPIALLDMVRPPTVEEEGADGAKWAAEWRDRVRAYHAQSQAAKTMRATMKPGDRLTFPEGWTPRALTITDCASRAVFGRDAEGRRFRLGTKALRAATLESAANEPALF